MCIYIYIYICTYAITELLVVPSREVMKDRKRVIPGAEDGYTIVYFATLYYDVLYDITLCVLLVCCILL